MALNGLILNLKSRFRPMALQFFTIDDRRRIVDILDLPITELEESSLLYRLLSQTEQRDDRLGTTLVQEVKNILTEATALQSEYFTAVKDGLDFKQEVKSDNVASVKYKERGGNTTALKERLKEYKDDLFQILRYYRQYDDNRLRTEWPSGNVYSTSYLGF